ncbi:Ca2+-binding protein, RTX toxin-related [Pseudovibrio sp. Tun.PSC04-5.I4]|nr:Ca2+-binding protein, RTX toxin-related [Pseudovibrio sp. Tun.PSC04-5.I4]
MSFSRSGEQYQNLTITYSATDSVTIVNQYAVIANFVGVQSESYASTIKFSDGTKLDLSEVEADLMVSGYGDDTLIGSGGADTFAASAGNDVLQGLHGDDTYHFNSGAGEDLILENSANLRYQTSHVEFGELPVDTYREIDKLEFGADISFEDLEFEVVGENSTDLKIYIKNSSDSITIKDQLNPQENWGRLSEVNIDAINADELGPNGEISKAYWMKNLASSFGVEALFSSGIERFIFADGTEYTRQEFATKVGYTEQTSEGFIFTDENGGTLDGGAGEDVLEGGTGNDIIKFGEGYDNDVVSDDGGWDTIEFNGDVSFGEIVFSRSGDDGNDLLIELAGVARNSMLIKDQLADNGKEVELFKLANGTYFTNKDIETILLSQSITDTADTIVAFNGDDHIEARNGDDEIEARRGNDTVDGGAGTDTVILKGKKAEYTVTQDGTYTVVDGPSGTKKLINVEKLVFVDNDGNEEVSVLVANIAPEATTAQFTSLEDHNLVLFVSDLLSYVNDPDGANPELVSVSNAVNGSVVIDAGVVKFVPLQDFYGTAQFEYTIRDAGGLEATGSVQLTISAVNDQPVVASVLVDQSTPESVAWNYTVPAETFSDIDGDSLVLAASLEDGTPLPTWLTFDAVTQTLFGTPPQDFVGTLDIQITASDGTAEVSDTFELTVAATNDAPVVAVAQQDKSIAEDTEWTYTIPTGAFTDENDDTLTLTATLADGSDLPDWLLFLQPLRPSQVCRHKTSPEHLILNLRRQTGPLKSQIFSNYPSLQPTMLRQLLLLSRTSLFLKTPPGPTQYRVALSPILMEMSCLIVQCKLMARPYHSG